jgi:hypothetical protein
MVENEQHMKEAQELARRRQEALLVENIDWVERRREIVRDLLNPINMLTDKLADLKKKKPDRYYWTMEDSNLEWILQGLVNAEHLTVGKYTCHDDYYTMETIVYRGEPELARNGTDPIRYHEHFGVGKRIPGYEEHMRGDIVDYQRDIHEVAVAQPEPQIYAMITRPFVGDNILREKVQAARVVPVSNEEVELWYTSQARLHKHLARLHKKRYPLSQSPQK